MIIWPLSCTLHFLIPVWNRSCPLELSSYQLLACCFVFVRTFWRTGWCQPGPPRYHSYLSGLRGPLQKSALTFRTWLGFLCSKKSNSLSPNRGGDERGGEGAQDLELSHKFRCFCKATPSRSKWCNADTLFRFVRKNLDVGLASWTLSVQKMHKSVQKMYTFCTVGDRKLCRFCTVYEWGWKRKNFH